MLVVEKLEKEVNQPMLLTRQIEADPPETTTQSATDHMSRAEGQDLRRLQEFRGATFNT